MYIFLKKITKKLIPKSILYRNEFLFRKLIYLKYKGNNYHCNACNARLKKFIPITDDLLCPACGSRSRTRLLWQILKEKHLIKGTILDFSPPRIIYRNFKKHTGIEYCSSDFENEFIADYHFDITKIEKEANSFDLIMCFHILEHISNDEKAINELYRVLKKEGIGLIQTPFKEGDIYEDYTIVSEEERLKAFGQEDHVRIYSVKGLTERLEKSGFKVTSIEQQPIPYLGINTETILLVKK